MSLTSVVGLEKEPHLSILPTTELALAYHFKQGMLLIQPRLNFLFSLDFKIKFSKSIAGQ